MTPAAARALALAAHADHRTDCGDPVIAHLERVARRVPSEAAPTAWLHEVGERGAASAHDLRAAGLSDVELAALELLTPAEGEDYRIYMWRIARAPGPAGAMARVVKLAEVTDHLERLPGTSAAGRRYRWAREQLERGRRRAERRAVGHEVEAA